MHRFKLTGPMLELLILPFLAACSDATESQQASDGPDARAVEELTVYKSPTCSCCKKWIGHLEAEGFETNTRHPADLEAIKDQYQIAPNRRSCHTAVSTQGYVFEGHIPARYIREFLTNPPGDAIGLAIPAMPLGSPGMEAGNRFMPYQILLLKQDGTSELFANVENAAMQYQQHQLEEQP